VIFALCGLALASAANRFFVEILPDAASPRSVDVTVENGSQPDFFGKIYGKGDQLAVDSRDFPALARTGLHSEAELAAVQTITGRPVGEITKLAQPGGLSTGGFLAAGEDIVSVLKADNRRVAKLGLVHRQLAEPMFHVWNLLLAELAAGRPPWGALTIRYQGQTIHLETSTSSVFQESIFDDEIRGTSAFTARRQPNSEETAFLLSRYQGSELATVLARLSSFRTGEMVPFYIARYGFYEGHTGFRADPLAIAFIFGLKSIQEIEAAFPGKLPVVLSGLSD
jgi:hypothetical protein